MRTSKGIISAHGLRCGLRATAESEKGKARLQASEHGKGYDVLEWGPEDKRLSWETYDTFKEARRDFGEAKGRIGYCGPVV